MNNKLMYKKVEVNCPVRLPVSEGNFEKLKFGEIGSGGIGLALYTKTKITIEAIDGEKDASNTHLILVKYFLDIMRLKLNINNHFKVTIDLENGIGEHKGFGFNAMFYSSIIYGINYMAGNKLSINQVQDIINTYFMELENNELKRDYCSGVAHAVCINGGLCFVSENGNFVSNYRIPKEYKVYLIRTDEKVNKTNDEKNKEITESLKNKNINFQYKSYYIYNEILPELRKDNFKCFINYINDSFEKDNQLLDSRFVKEKSVRTVIEKFKEINNTMYKLSPNGSYIYLISPNEDEIENICKENEYDFKKFKVNNNGIRILKKELA